MQKLKQIPKRVHHFLIGLVLTAVLGVLAFAVVNTYTAYTDMVVQQQQQYLLVTARAVSKTLSLYISGQLRDIEILTRSPGFLTEFENYYETGGDTALREHIVSYMLSQKRGVKRIYLLDKNGDVMYQYNDYPFLEVFDESLLHLKEYATAHTSGIGSVFRISPQHYGLTLVNDVIHGSEFLVYLPVTAQAVAPERPAAPGAPVRLNSGKQPILLVDDEERVARYLKRRLTRSGYTVDVFTDAEEALDAFLASPTRWQLALVDGTMPKYKGTALIQRMRSENPNLAAILMTGFVEQDAVQMQQEGLIDEIFLKPLDYRKLTEKIGKLLAGEPDLTTV